MDTLICIMDGVTATHTDMSSLGPKPPLVVAANEDIKQRFRKLDPPINDQILPEESVRMQLKVIDDLDLAKSGSFLSHHGVKNRW